MFLWGELEYIVQERQAEIERRIQHNRLLHASRQGRQQRRTMFLRRFIRILGSLRRRFVDGRHGLGEKPKEAEKRVLDLQGGSPLFATRGGVRDQGKPMPATPSTCDCGSRVS